MNQLEHPMVTRINQTGLPMGGLEMRRFKAKISASVDLIVWIKESDNGEQEIEEVDEVLDVEDFENVREL